MIPIYKYIERSNAAVEERTRNFARSVSPIARDTIWIVGVEPKDVAPLVLDSTTTVTVENRDYTVGQIYQHPMQGWKVMLVPKT